MTTFKFAVNKLKRAAKDWMTDEDYPAMHALEAMAEALDKNLSPSILSAYLVAYRAFLQRKPQNAAEEDELERELRLAQEEEL